MFFKLGLLACFMQKELESKDLSATNVTLSQKVNFGYGGLLTLEIRIHVRVFNLLTSYIYHTCLRVP